MAEKFGLAELINRAVERGARDLFTCLPAKVTKWDASTGKANCQILVQDAYEDEEGNRQVVSWPIVSGVAVQFMGTGAPGGFRMTCPISDGTLNINGSTIAATMGTLFFAHRSLDKWTTGSGSEVDPEIDHAHALTDAIFMPGLMPFGAPWQNVPTAAGSVGFDNGLQMLNDGMVITLAQQAASATFVALGDKVDAELTKISTTLASLTGGAMAPATFGTAYSKASVQATKVKAQ